MRISILQIFLAGLLPCFLFAQKPYQEIMPDMSSRQLIAEGVRLHDEAKYDSALIYFNWVNPNDSFYAWAAGEKANTLIALERYEEAIAVSEEVLKTPGDNRGMIYSNLGTAYDESERSDDAIDAYNRGIADSPFLTTLYFNRGITQNRQEKYSHGVQSIQHALQLNPFHASSHYVLGNLALAQGDMVPATLSLCAFLMLEPNSGRSNEVLSNLNSALAEKSETENLGVDFGTEFSKIELLVKNYAALRESYKVPSDLPLPIVKQSHLIFSQLKTTNGGWWTDYYAQFFSEIVNDKKLFEGFSYLIMIPSTAGAHQKTIEKNLKLVKEFASWANTRWTELHEYFPDTLQGKNVTLRYLRDENHSVEAVGAWDKKIDKPVGYYRLYDANGKLSSEGSFSSTGDRDGLWKFYYPNGILKEELTYKAGSLEGTSYFYEDDSSLSIAQDWENDERNGSRKTYWTIGTLLSESSYKAGKTEGVYQSYYPQGQPDFKVDVKNDLTDGEGIAYFPTGKKESSAIYKAGKRNGPLLRYHFNGNLRIESNYVDDLLNGPYKEYYENGQLSVEGSFVKDNRSGKWVHYHSDGSKDMI